MSGRKIIDYSSILRKLDRQVEKNFSSQTKFLRQLVRTKSVNTGVSPGTAVERAVSGLVYNKLKSWKLFPRRVVLDRKRPNIICAVGPKRFRKSLILIGHMDTAGSGEGWTVDPFGAEIKEGRMYGVGSLDMKATLSAYIFGLKAILDERLDLEGGLLLTMSVDAMSGPASKIGTDYLIRRRGLKAKAAILGEPGSGKVAIGHRGGYRFLITTFGEAVHTGMSDWEKGKRGRNAVLDMARVAVALQKIELPYKQSRAFPGRVPVFTFPTKIAGGTAADMVPDRCEAEGDVRLMPGNSDRQIRIWIEDCLKERCPDVLYEVADLAYVPSVEISKNEEIVELLSKNSVEILGRKPKMVGAGPWNEAWMLITRDIPTVAGFGPDGGNAQAADEYVDLESLQAITKIYARVMVEYLGLAK